MRQLNTQLINELSKSTDRYPISIEEAAYWTNTSIRRVCGVLNKKYEHGYEYGYVNGKMQLSFSGYARVSDHLLKSV